MEEKERVLNQSVPLFRTWEEVITAYTAGLMPIVCKGNTDRFMDYTALLLSLITEHAKGQRHWPVFLRYIESRRRKVLLYGAAADDAEAAEARKAHRLTAISPEGNIIMDNELLRDIADMWSSRSRLFEDEFVDPHSLDTLYSERTAVEKSALERHRLSQPTQYSAHPSPSPATQYQQQHHTQGNIPYYNQSANASYNSYPQPPPSFQSPQQSPPPRPQQQQRPRAQGETTTGTTRLPAGLYYRIRKLKPPNNNICIAHLQGSCPSPCTESRQHVAMDRVQQLLGGTQ